MAELCILIKNKDGGGYTDASIQDLRQFIADTLYDAQYEAELAGPNYSREMKKLLKKALYKIGDTYSNVYINEVVR